MKPFYIPLMTALTAALISLKAIPGVAADNVQSAIEELAARPSGGGGDPGPVAAASVSVDPIEGLAAADAQSALAELAARPSGGGETGPVAASAVSVDPIEGLTATDAQTALAELAARPSGGSALPNAGELPGSPAFATFDVGAMMWPQPWDSLQFTIGDRYHPDVSPEAGESWTDFFTRIGGLGLADFNNENPLTVSVAGNVVTISSTARLRSNSGFFFTAIGQPLDASPTATVAVDTNSTAVAHDGEQLSVVVDRLIARPLVPDPRSVIRGVRSHDGYPTLVSKGAVAGDYLNVSVANRSTSFAITETTTIVDVSAWLRESTVLNPQGPGTEIDCDFDALRAIVIWSKSGQIISLSSSFGGGSGLASLLGSLPQ